MAFTKPLLFETHPEKVLQFGDKSLNPNQTALLTLTNVTQQDIAFKVKTTAPKHYLVRPSAGVIAVGGQHNVQIVLQDFNEDEVGTSDRFLIQAVVHTGPSQLPLPKDYWQTVDKADLQERKLIVVFQKGSAAQVSASDSSQLAAARGHHQQGAAVPMAGGALRKPPIDPARGPPPAASPRANPENLLQQYNELVQLYGILEKQKNVQTKELEALRAASGGGKPGVPASSGSAQIHCPNCGVKYTPSGGSTLGQSGGSTSLSAGLLAAYRNLASAVVAIAAVAFLLRFFGLLG